MPQSREINANNSCRAYCSCTQWPANNVLTNANAFQSLKTRNTNGKHVRSRSGLSLSRSAKGQTTTCPLSCLFLGRAALAELPPLCTHLLIFAASLSFFLLVSTSTMHITLSLLGPLGQCCWSLLASLRSSCVTHQPSDGSTRHHLDRKRSWQLKKYRRVLLDGSSL